MPTFVAFLRAINLGKHRRVPMAELRAALSDAGYADVRTHLQSGNVVLESRSRAPAGVERSLERLLQDVFHLEVDVMVRTASELAKVTRTNPFLRRRSEPATLHVGFLKRPAPATAVRNIAKVDFGRDEFEVHGAEIYLRYPDGLARSKMSTPFFERALGSPVTVRTWNVVSRLVELSS